MNNTPVTIMNHGVVSVIPVTDVRKNSRVMAISEGRLAMRRPGRLPKGAVMLWDARWTADAKAGELTQVEIGVMAGKQARKLVARAMLRSD